MTYEEFKSIYAKLASLTKELEGIKEKLDSNKTYLSEGGLDENGERAVESASQAIVYVEDVMQSLEERGEELEDFDEFLDSLYVESEEDLED